MLRFTAVLALVTASIAASGPAYGLEINLSGTRTAINQWAGHYGGAVTFQDPAISPIFVTGTVNISGFATDGQADNSILTVGIISKDRYDAWVAGSANFPPPISGQDGWFETAYGAYQYTDNAAGTNPLFRGALGQNLALNGETLQTYTDAQPNGMMQVDIVFDATGFRMTLNGQTIERSYSDAILGIDLDQVPFSFITMGTDFSSGAVAVIGGFSNRTGAIASYDVTFFQADPAPVPEPASLAIWGIGSVGLWLGARRKLRLEA